MSPFDPGALLADVVTDTVIEPPAGTVTELAERAVEKRDVSPRSPDHEEPEIE